MARTGPLVRTAIIVSDLERSLAFYRDLLGFEEVYFEGRIEDSHVGRLLGIPDASIMRCVIVKAPGPAIGMVGLFEVCDAPPPARQVQDGLCRGDTCLVFNHRDLAALERTLREAGCPIVCPPTRLRVSGDIESLEMTFRDPDGVLINCIERDPG